MTREHAVRRTRCSIVARVLVSNKDASKRDPIGDVLKRGGTAWSRSRDANATRYSRCAACSTSSAVVQTYDVSVHQHPQPPWSLFLRRRRGRSFQELAMRVVDVQPICKEKPL
jgi:hypothetical protein